MNWIFNKLIDRACYTCAFIAVSAGTFQLIQGCISPTPAMDSVTNEIVADVNGDTTWDYAAPWNAKAKINRALNSKGFQRYKADSSALAAKHWTDLSYYAGILTGVFILAWYFTKIKEMGGAAILCMIFSLVAVGMAELVSNVGKILMIGAAVIVIAGGLYFRNKSITTTLRKLSR